MDMSLWCSDDAVVENWNERHLSFFVYSSPINKQEMLDGSNFRERIWMNALVHQQIYRLHL